MAANGPSFTSLSFKMTQNHTMRLIILLLVCSLISSADLPPDFLTEDSVVLITGAAGFIGSELAMAIHRTYNPKKIICIDSMDRGSGKMTPESIMEGHSEDPDLALLEFKRQRVWNLLQTIGNKAHFYRVDFRPSVPEFYESGEVPILHHIFSFHSDITHVVHLADHFHRGVINEKSKQSLLEQAVPRISGQPKAGMMESLLEELLLVKQSTGKAPHFVYASSHEVYNNKKVSIFREQSPNVTPSNFAGASKLMDEVLANTYFEHNGIFSVGLRLFSVYGPWGLPGSPLFEMAEKAVLGGNPTIESDIFDDIRDYIYIDDAVDAIMSAMQFRNEQSLVINVGTGKGSTLREIAKIMGSYFDQQVSDGDGKLAETVSVASTERAKELLGFSARVPLQEGVEQLLAWHYDRAFPYGGSKSNKIAKAGIASCSVYDSECLRGAAVFPCASECAHKAKCTSSLFDDVVSYTKQVTKSCETVLYTVSLEDSVATIPSAQFEVSSKSESFVKGRCNIAIVSDTSLLVQRLQVTGRNQEVLQYGPWVLVPVSVSKYAAEHIHILRLLPKLSPGQFFGPTTTRAIYADPNVMFDSIPRLLEEFEKSPGDLDGPVATALLVGKTKRGRAQAPSFVSDLSNYHKSNVQEAAYRMLRIAAIDEMNTQAFSQHVDSSFLVHALQSDDSRLFRCDIFSEIIQWDVNSDSSAIEFIAGLHDMWSRVLVKKKADKAWWVGENMDVKAGPSEQVQSSASDSDAAAADHVGADEKEVDMTDLSGEVNAAKSNREGGEDEQGQKEPGEKEEKDEEAEMDSEGEEDANEQGLAKDTMNEDKKEMASGEAAFEMDGEENIEDESGDSTEEQRRRLSEEDAADDVDAGNTISGWGEEHNGFGMPEAIQEAVRAVFGEAPKPEDTLDDDEVESEEGAQGAEEEDEEEEEDNHEKQAKGKILIHDAQPSQPTDEAIWMGVLSSSQTQFFARLVPSKDVGVVHLDEFTSATASK